MIKRFFYFQNNESDSSDAKLVFFLTLKIEFNLIFYWCLITKNAKLAMLNSFFAIHKKGYSSDAKLVTYLHFQN